MRSVYLICFSFAFALFIYFFMTSVFKRNNEVKKIDIINKRKIIILSVSFVVISVALNVLFALLACALYVFFKRSNDRKKKLNYIKKIDKQIIEAIKIFRNVILSGQSLLQAVDAVSVQIKQPLSDEFKKISDKVSLGVGLDEALRESSSNIDSQQYRLFIDSVRISNTTGAKLSDILDKIEKSVTQRLTIYSKVEALTSQAKISSNIITVVPFFIVIFIYFAEPDIMGVLFTTLFGNIILSVSIFMMLLGLFFMRKISEIDI